MGGPESPDPESPEDPMPIVSLTDARAAEAVPAVRHAFRAAGGPAWARTLLAALMKWLPVLLQICAQLAPLFAAPAGSAGSVDDPDVSADPAIRPEVRSAILARRYGSYRA